MGRYLGFDATPYCSNLVFIVGDKASFFENPSKKMNYKYNMFLEGEVYGYTIDETDRKIGPFEIIAWLD